MLTRQSLNIKKDTEDLGNKEAFMLKRTLTGAVILLITIGFVLLKQFNNLFFDAFALIVMCCSLYETINAYKKAGKKPHTALLFLAPLFIYVGLLFSRRLYAGIDVRVIFGSIISLIIVAVIMLMAFLTLDIMLAAKSRKLSGEMPEEELVKIDAFSSSKVSMQILAYPILPLSFFLLLNNLSYQLSFLGIILTFAVAMMTDTFAYLFGRAWGKRKFIPEVSPKKTIAGVVGGFVGGVIGSALVFVFFYFTPYFDILNNVDLFSAITAVALIGILGSYITQLGDLIASSLKRKVGIKDYANIFPGHGGFMDRFDGQMFVAFLSFIVLVLFFV